VNQLVLFTVMWPYPDRQHWRAQIWTPNTRHAYARAAVGFFEWLEARGVTLEILQRAAKILGRELRLEFV
jgi:hypothetical protein